MHTSTHIVSYCNGQGWFHVHLPMQCSSLTCRPVAASAPRLGWRLLSVQVSSMNAWHLYTGAHSHIGTTDQNSPLLLHLHTACTKVTCCHVPRRSQDTGDHSQPSQSWGADRASQLSLRNLSMLLQTQSTTKCCRAEQHNDTCGGSSHLVQLVQPIPGAHAST